MLLSAAEMQAHESAVIAGGLSAAVLMDRAADGIANLVREFFPRPGTLVCYCGKGNNGGDALAAAVRLQRDGWKILTRLSDSPASLRGLPVEHWTQLNDQQTSCASAIDVTRHHQNGPLVLLDGLIGLGSSGPLRGTLRELAAEMNDLRLQQHAVTLAIDIPSGVHPDTGEPSADAVIADITATIAIPKVGLVRDNATAHVGRIAVIPVERLSKDADKPASLEPLSPSLLRPLLPRRSFAMHKGQAGRVSIIAGSTAFPGAALLACMGALRGGAGLITLCVPEDVYGAVIHRLPPEVMLRVISDYEEAISGSDVVAIGPGLGGDHDLAVTKLIRGAKQPMVVDADALNALARSGLHHLKEAAGPRLLTPHPGEMARLYNKDKGEGATRREVAEQFASEFSNCTLLLKGSRSIIATAGLPSRINTTGHPGMAAGGMGDILTGLTAALVAQGCTLHDSASLGSWLLGRAAERAICGGTCSPESLSASDVANHLGSACNSLRLSPF